MIIINQYRFAAAVAFTNVTYSTTGGTFVQDGGQQGWGDNGTGLSSLTMAADGLYKAEFNSSANYTAVIALDPVNSNTDYTQYDYGIFVGGDGNFYRIVSGAFTSLGIAAVSGDWIGLRRVGSTVTAEYERGGVWTVLYTFGTTTSATLYLKANAASPGAWIRNPKATGV